MTKMIIIKKDHFSYFSLSRDMSFVILCTYVVDVVVANDFFFGFITTMIAFRYESENVRE